MKIAFTIIFNGLHHLKHNGFAENMLNIFDHWIVVEGGASPNGSTSWCKPISNRWHRYGHSVDGTLEYLTAINSNKLHIVTREGFWRSKDQMVNAALDCAEKLCNGNAWLFEVDADEQWTRKQVNDAITMLRLKNGTCGCFHCAYFVGKDLVATGEWGEGRCAENPAKNAYRRLWRWSGQRFATHEPPLMVGGNGTEVLLPQRFNHYAYYFEQDVEFKGEYYTNHERVLSKWKTLNESTSFPQKVNMLISGPWSNTNTKIVKINDL